MKPVRLWIGLVLVVVGLAGVLDAVGVSGIGPLLGKVWPVALIGLGLTAMLVQRRPTFGAVVVTVAGVVFLAGSLGWATGGLVWSGLMLLGGVMVLARMRRHAVTEYSSPASPVVMFGGSKVKNRSRHLTHADVSAVFGGATLDLRDAHIDTEARIDVLAVFGGVEVLVPENWRVHLVGTPVLGGVEDKTVGNGTQPADAPTLTVNATAIFGAVEVANQEKEPMGISE